MLCALSQFLDRNAHVADPPPAFEALEGGLNGDREGSYLHQSVNSYGPTAKGNKKGGGDLCMWDSIKLQLTNRLPDFSNLKALLVQRKSSRNSQQNHFHPYRASKDYKQEKDEDCLSDTEVAASPQVFNNLQLSEGHFAPKPTSVDATDQSALTCPQQQGCAQESAGNTWRHNRRHLPVPTGPHTVGCVDLMCDLADQGTFFRLYYPTNPTDIQRAYKQWPLWLPRKQYAHGYMYFLKKNTTIFGRLAHWLGGDVYVPVLWQAPLLRSDEVFPVLIVSHGIGGNRTTLSTYCYQLASRGFVVAAIEHRDGTASMTLCLKEHLESTIIDSDEADNRSNNNNITLNNNKVKTNLQQSVRSTNSNQHQLLKPESEFVRPLRKNMSEPASNSQHMDVLMENLCEFNELDELQTAIVSGLVADCESETKSSDCKSLRRVTFGLDDEDSASTDKYPGEGIECSNNSKDTATSDGATGLSQSQRSQAFRAHVRSKSYSGTGNGNDGACVRKHRENRRRSLRHNHSCSEEWRPFQHVEIWDDFDYRNSQMYQRADEISDLLDELISMNAGGHINNALGLAFNTIQFKNRLDISRVAVIGHSFGGAAALATLVTDERFKVGLCLDSWMHPLDSHVYNNTKQPALFLNMEEFQWEKNVNRMIRFQEAKPEADRPMMTLMGGCHQSMSDFQFIMPQVVGRLIDVCHTLPPAQCMSTILDASLAFLRKHIDLPVELQDEDILACNHPHLIQGTNVDLTIPDEGPTPS